MATYDNAKQYLEDFNTALDQEVSVPTDVEVTPEGAVVKGETTYTVRELICSLLAGNGIKLPNLQICLKINLSKALDALGAELGNPDLSQDIKDGIQEAMNAIEEAEAALDEFIEHTGIDETLDRANAAIAEFAAVANMINFCGTPIVPRPIPNVLDDLFGAFTGAGKDLLDELGTMLDSDIGGCINFNGQGGSFNFGLFQGGALKSIDSVLTNIEAGVLGGLQSDLSAISGQLNGFAGDMRELISFENDFANKSTSGSSGKGGSTFSPVDRVNTGIGVKVDTENMDLQTAQRYASNLKAAYDQLSAYRLKDGKHLFEHILEPEMLNVIKSTDGPDISVGERTPVYDYCGRIIGYTEASDTVTETSSGTELQENTQPGTTQVSVTTTPPETPIGRPGDSNGDIAYDEQYMYVATADYDGTTAIWIRTALDTNW